MINWPKQFRTLKTKIDTQIAMSKLPYNWRA